MLSLHHGHALIGHLLDKQGQVCVVNATSPFLFNNNAFMQLRFRELASTEVFSEPKDFSTWDDFPSSNVAKRSSLLLHL